MICSNKSCTYLLFGGKNNDKCNLCCCPLSHPSLACYWKCLHTLKRQKVLIILPFVKSVYKNKWIYINFKFKISFSSWPFWWKLLEKLKLSLKNMHHILICAKNNYGLHEEWRETINTESEGMASHISCNYESNDKLNGFGAATSLLMFWLHSQTCCGISEASAVVKLHFKWTKQGF